MDNGGLCTYLEDVLSTKRHPISSQAMFCAALLIYSTTLLTLSVSDIQLYLYTESVVKLLSHRLTVGDLYF